MGSERRRAPRYAFIAAAEVTELQSDTCIRARVSDLSRVGCYLDMINPLAVGTEVHVQITHQKATFAARAAVKRSETSLGMGIIFTAVEPDQQAILERWVADISKG